MVTEVVKVFNQDLFEHVQVSDQNVWPLPNVEPVTEHKTIACISSAALPSSMLRHNSLPRNRSIFVTEVLIVIQSILQI